jgi:hypothetical protein
MTATTLGAHSSGVEGKDLSLHEYANLDTACACCFCWLPPTRLTGAAVPLTDSSSTSNLRPRALGRWADRRSYRHPGARTTTRNWTTTGLCAITPTNIDIDEEGGVQIYFDDGGLFLGHSIVVFLDASCSSPRSSWRVEVRGRSRSQPGVIRTRPPSRSRNLCHSQNSAAVGTRSHALKLAYSGSESVQRWKISFTASTLCEGAHTPLPVAGFQLWRGPLAVIAGTMDRRVWTAGSGRADSERTSA